MYRLACAMVIVAFTVAGCGNTTEERGISGAGIGAGAGAYRRENGSRPLHLKSATHGE